MYWFRRACWAALLTACWAVPAAGWDYLPLNVSADDPESRWRDELARVVNGRKEVTVTGGRVDVLTAEMAIELDRLHKWHEGIGQVLHYATLTRKTPVLALMAYARTPQNLRTNTLRRLALVEKTCRAHGIRLLVLLPQQPRHDAADQPAGTRPKYWLNLRTGVRHRPGCRFYRNTEEGRFCGPDEGRPCALCGP